MLRRIVKRDRLIDVRAAFRKVSRNNNDAAIRRCATMSGTVAFCFSANARNWVASWRTALPLNATKLTAHEP